MGRQLYPKLDLWQTAKPFLEKWMKQQVGPSAMVNNLKERLPYWTEKLPEMPDLLYDTMRQVRSLPNQLAEQHKEQMAQQASLQRGRFMGHIAVILSSAAVVTLVFDKSALYTLCLALGAGICWIYAFRRST